MGMIIIMMALMTTQNLQQITKLKCQQSHRALEHDQSVNLSWNLSDDQKHRQMVALAKILMEIVAKKNQAFQIWCAAVPCGWLGVESHVEGAPLPFTNDIAQDITNTALSD